MHEAVNGAYNTRITPLLVMLIVISVALASTYGQISRAESDIQSKEHVLLKSGYNPKELCEKSDGIFKPLHNNDKAYYCKFIDIYRK
jgi:hypothetical protein